jgi:hypothetical protein
MQLLLISKFNKGELFIIEHNIRTKICDTLEPLHPVIPAGEHILTMYSSPKWSAKSKCILPFYVLLFTTLSIIDHAFEIHIGCTIKDTNACILVGELSNNGTLINSTHTFFKLICHILVKQCWVIKLTIQRTNG